MENSIHNPHRRGSGGNSNKRRGSFNSWRSANASAVHISDARKLERLERFASQPNVSTAAAAAAANWRKGGQDDPASPVGFVDVESFGFVSKGDERLKDFRNQELFHKFISKKYLDFCGTSGGSDQLEVDFASLALTPLNNPRSTAVPPVASSSSSSSTNSVYTDSRNAELSSILLNMRKLREGVVASRRTDRFAVDVFKQHIRAAILVQQIESYHPALLHLLYTLHALHPLPPLDVQEFAGYHMLHLAARLEEYGAALAVKAEFRVADRRALQALGAIIHGNYWSYRAARNRVDQYVGRLMDFAEDRMRRLMLKCVGAAYMTIDLPYLEVVSGMSWRKLKEVHKVGWELNGATKTVTVKRPKMRTKPAVAVVEQGFQAWD